MFIKVKSFLTFSFLLVSCLAFGQLKSSYTPSELDSLWSVWQNRKEADTMRLNAIAYYSWYKFMFSQPDSAYYYADLQHDLAKKIGSKRYIASALSAKGTAHWVKGDYAKSLDFFKKTLEIRKEIGNKEGIAAAYNKLGIVYGDLGDNIKRIEYYQKSLKIREESGDDRLAAFVLSNIGALYQDQGNNSKALEYHQRCLKIREELGEQGLIAFTLAHIGEIYEDYKDYDTAYKYYTKSLKLGEEFGEKKHLAWYLENMGDLFKIKKNYPEALRFYQRSMQLLVSMNAQADISGLLINIGELHFSQKQYSKSIEKCKESYNIAINIIDVKRQKEACECLYKGYKALKNNNQALGYHEKILTLSDSLRFEETAKKLQQMEFAKIILKDSIANANKARIAKEQIEIQESKISLLNTKNRVKSLWIIFGSLAATLVMGMIYYRYQQRVKYKDLHNEFLNSELEYKKKDLTNFAVNISTNQEWAMSLSERIDALKTSTGRKRAKELEDLDNEIKNKIWVDRSADEFYTKVDSLSSSFFDKLTKQFDDLTKTEIRLCSLIKLDLDTKQIAALQNISPSSVKMSRYRLRKKLNLSPEDDLNAFLRSF